MPASDSRDREAIEQIRGRPLSHEWPAGAHPAGTRVTVIQDSTWPGPWRQEFSATIDAMGAPEPVTHPSARARELAYWVQFDQPQFDADGMGPYRKALIWDRYLRAEP